MNKKHSDTANRLLRFPFPNYSVRPLIGGGEEREKSDINQQLLPKILFNLESYDGVSFKSSVVNRLFPSSLLYQQQYNSREALITLSGGDQNFTQYRQRGQ